MKTAALRRVPDADLIDVARYIEESSARLARPEQWSQNAMCRDENGEELIISDIDPASFCLGGGFERTYVEWAEFRDMEKEELDRVSDAALDILFNAIDEHYPYRYESIPHFNDSNRTTHVDILRILDFSDAIASVETRGMV